MAIIYRIEGLVPTSERYQKYSSRIKRMAIIYRIEGLVPTSERYQKYYWLKYIKS